MSMYISCGMRGPRLPNSCASDIINMTKLGLVVHIAHKVLNEHTCLSAVLHIVTFKFSSSKVNTTWEMFA